MAINDAEKFFEDNITRHVNVRSDPAGSNLNKGLLKLVSELHSEIQRLHQEIAHVSQQVAQLAGR